MEKEVKFHLALIQIDNLTKIIDGNEYQQFLINHLVPIKIELERQLSNLKR